MIAPNISPVETAAPAAPRTERGHAAYQLVARLLLTHADLAAAGAVARRHGLTRCADQLARQTGAVATEILSLITDITAPSARLTEDVP